MKFPRSAKSSTDRRKDLSNFIQSQGREMVRKCSRCRKDGKVCKVHIRSGMCGTCVLNNYSDCDVRVTELEWKKLRSERKKLMRALEEAREESNKAMSKEMRLRRQLEQLEEREGDAISVEERDIREQEAEEGPAVLNAEDATDNPSPSLALSPWTWNSIDGFSDELWEFPEIPNLQPEVSL